jgi:pimeloyl-ACP methyl ester carboxylesterase
MTGQDALAGLSREFAGGIAFLRRAGDARGPTLVLLHGIGSNAASFAALAAAMPAAVNVIAWNAPGYGDSAPLATAIPTPRDYADALARFLDALNPSRNTPRIALLGHSLGVLFAASFAARYPDRVNALALISPAMGYGVEPGGKLPPGVQSRIDEINELGPVAFAKKRAARLVGDPSARPDIVAAVEQAMAAVNPCGYIQAVHALGAGRLLADVKSIRVPVLVAVGTKDLITPPANAAELHAALPRSAGFHQIANAGHALPQEEPQALAALLARTTDTMAHA